MTESKDTSTKIEINSDILRNTKCHIAVACTAGMLTHASFMSFIKFTNTARELEIDWTIETFDASDINSKNLVVAKFLNSNSTHLFFIDSSFSWEPWHLMLLVTSDKDVVSGLFPKNALPLTWDVQAKESLTTTDSNYLPVKAVSAKFLCIKRHVFERLKLHKNIADLDTENQELQQHYMAYFCSTVRGKSFLSSEIAFCHNWQDMGGEIFVDKRVLLGLQGPMHYHVTVHNTLLNKYANIVADISQKENT